MTGLPAWLFEECYHTVGDLAETIALLLPETEDEAGTGAGGETNTDEGSTEGNDGVETGTAGSGYSLADYLRQLVQIGKEEEAVKKEFVLRCWRQMIRSPSL